MTDYLEFQEEEDSLDLWEEARRLDDVLARMTAGEASVRQTGAEGLSEDGPGRTAVRSEEEENKDGGFSAALPLLDEAERLDRVLDQIQSLERENRPAAPAEGLTAWEREAVRSWLSGTGGGATVLVREDPLDGPAGRTPMGGGSVSPMDWGTETAQAERIDLLFRRDSRRYDGPFFLY